MERTVSAMKDALISFEWDSRDLKFWRGKHMEGALARALRLAGNQAIRVAQKESTEHVTSRKHLSEKTVEEGLPLVVPGRKAALRDLAWRLKMSGEPMPLSRFPFIVTRTGISARVNRGQGTKRIKSAFASRMASGHLGIFRRRGKASLPIDELWTSRISDVMSDAGALPKVERQAMNRFDSAFARGLDRELRKARGKGVV